MARPLALLDFGHKQSSQAISNPLTEKDCLESFEKGYRAGWDDATRSAEEHKNKFQTDLAENLKDISFTFHEARAQILRALEPLIQALFSQILPEALKHSMPEIIAERLGELLAKEVDVNFSIAVAPGLESLVSSHLSLIPDFSVQVETDLKLSEGQVIFRTSTGDHLIDFARALEAMEITVSEFFATILKEAASEQ